MTSIKVYPTVLQACMAVGVKYQEVPSDGRFHTVPLADGSDKTAGRIKYYPNGGGAAHNWKTFETAFFFSQQKSSGGNLPGTPITITISDEHPDGAKEQSPQTKRNWKTLIISTGEESYEIRRISGKEERIYRCSTMPQACLSVGVEYQEVPSDGRFHIVPLADGSDKTAGRIKYFPTGGGIAINWKTSETAYFFPDLTRDQIKAQQLKNQQTINSEKAKDHQRFLVAQEKALEILAKAKAATAENPYLKRQQLKPKGELKALPLSEIEQCLDSRLYGKIGRFKEGEILIAPRRQRGEITTLEFIAGDGNETYLRNGHLNGAYWISNREINEDGLNEKICICEGLSTALSVAENAGITTVSVGACNNFDSCTQAVKDAYPEAEIVILADAGLGEEIAKECAEKYGLIYLPPILSI
jgi:hypothetical protein